MIKKFFPLFMDLTEKKIVVIGGGTIASRRIKTLTEFSNHILVVAPVVTKEIEQLIAEGKICRIEDVYRIEQLKEADIVIAATNRQQVNQQVLADVRSIEKKENRRILVNVVDDKECCDFYFPGIVQKEEAVIGISTCGTSPGKSKQLRKNIEEWLESESIY